MNKMDSLKTQKFINFFSANKTKLPENDAYLFPTLTAKSDLSEKLEMPLQRSNYSQNIQIINKIESKGIEMSREAYYADFDRSILERKSSKRKITNQGKNHISALSTLNTSEGEEDIKILSKIVNKI